MTEQALHARQVFQDLMAHHRMRQTDLAKAIGAKQSQVSQALSGQIRMPNGWYPKIAVIYGISPTVFETSIIAKPKVVIAHTRRPRRPPKLTEQNIHARKVLHALIDQSKLRQTDLANAIGATQSSVSRALSGRLRIPHRWYVKIAAIFGTSPESFENP